MFVENRTALVVRALKPLVFLVCLLPAGLLAWDAWRDGLGANPIEEITHRTGIWALRLLLVTLAITPLRRLTGWNGLIRLRRMLGLFAFFYVLLHVTTYVWLDQSLAFGSIVEDVLKRPYITLGFLAFVLLVPLALTSTNGMIRRLGGRRWKRLHRLAYACGGLGALHYLWLVKADVRAPMLYLAILSVLLIARLPVFSSNGRGPSRTAGDLAASRERATSGAPDGKTGPVSESKA